MHTGKFCSTAVLVLTVAGPALANDAGLQVAQRGIDTRTAADFLSEQATETYHADWRNGPGARGVSGGLGAAQIWYHGKGRSDRAASASHALASSLRLSYSNGVSWTLDLTGTRIDGRTQFGTLGRYDISGYGFAVSGTHRYGDFLLGTQETFVWLDFNKALRKTPGADAASKSHGYAENMGAEAGYLIGGQFWSVIPSFGIQYQNVTMSRFSESGLSAMEFSKSDNTGWKASAGLTTMIGHVHQAGFELRPTLDVRYERWLGADHVTLTGHPLAQGGSVTTPAALAGRDSVVVRPGLYASLGKMLDVCASGLYRWQKDVRENGVMIKLVLHG